MMKSFGRFAAAVAGWSLLTGGFLAAGIGLMAVTERTAGAAALPIGDPNDPYHSTACETPVQPNPGTSGCAWRTPANKCDGDCNKTTNPACVPVPGPPPKSPSCLQITIPGSPTSSDCWCQGR